ncbi:hypothetical protein ACN28I_27265 [Archangium gephyra]
MLSAEEAQPYQRQFGLTGDQLYGLLDTIIQANPEDPASAVAAG